MEIPPPTNADEDAAQAILQRTDELYELLRAKRFPDWQRHRTIPDNDAHPIRARAHTIAILEHQRREYEKLMRGAR